MGISQICSLLNTNNSPRESQNILSIRDHDDDSRQFHKVLTDFSKHSCDILFELHGPTSSRYVNNDFLTWMNISAANMNTKGLYSKILKCNYSSSELTAIKKLNKVPLIGPLEKKRICNAMQRISKAVNSARSLRASIEFCLGSFRSNMEISAFLKSKQQTCFCCGIVEKRNSCNEKGRNPIFHLLYDGAPACFLRNHLRNYARRILDQSFEITISSIVLNEIPSNIVKRCNNQSLRRWYTLINIFKTTLYALYYRQPLFDKNVTVIIKTFNHHLRAAKRAATERKSDILEKILFLPKKDDSVAPFYKILNETHHDTALFRRKDNKDFCFLSDYRKKLSRTQNFHRKQNFPKMSKEKKELLIENAFKRAYNRTNLSQVQGIDLCNKV